MKFTVDYPIVVAGYDPALVTAAGMTRVAQAVEEGGYDAISFSEHPAPSAKWLNAGGHESLDQTSALAFCAAVTSRVRLMTYLLVLPYHNPFLTAKALSTVDLLSGGRLTVVAGTGYLRSEFLALNVDMNLRNELFDESLEVLRGVWTEVPFAYAGKHFTARGVASLPGPAQRGGPPVLIGGNSAVARGRAARNQGWSPLMVSPEVADLAYAGHRRGRGTGGPDQGGPRRRGPDQRRRRPADDPGAHAADGLHAAAGVGRGAPGPSRPAR